MPNVATSPADLAGRDSGERPPRWRPPGHRRRGAPSAAGAIRDLAWTAAFSTDEATTAAAQWLVWEASQVLGARSASIQGLYDARARGEVPGSPCRRSTFVPRPSTWPGSCSRRRRRPTSGAVILELARSEQTYTFQRPIDYATSVLAGAIAAGWQRSGLHPGRPLPVQREEVRRRPRGHDRGDPARLPPRHRCRLSQHRHRFVDPGRPVSKPNVDEEQRENYTRAAELTALIRTLETDGVTISVGGEIGEVGTQNSTVAELRAYLDGYRRELDALAPGARGISKVSVQTGTSPWRRAAARTAAWRRSSSTSRCCASLAWSPANTVWPGPSSTALRRCRTSLFHRFPAVETAEIHLATGFQNALYEHPAFPRDAPSRDRGLVLRQRAPTSARPARRTSSSSTRRARRRSGRSSASSGTSTTKDEILAAQRRKISYLFTELGVNDSRAMVDRHVQPVEIHRPIPDALRQAVAAR